MGELSGHLLFLITLLLAGATLAGCTTDEPAPDEPPPPVETLIFGGSSCLALVVAAAADADAVDGLLPQGFASIRDPVTDFATVEATMLECLSGRIGDQSLGVEQPMSLWYLETPVAAPDWAAAETASTHFVLGLHSDDPRLHHGLAAMNLSLTSGSVQFGASAAAAASPDGSLSASQALERPGGGSTERRHILPQINGTLAAWNIRSEPGVPVGGFYDVTAEAGTLWADLVGVRTIGQGYHVTDPGGQLYEFGPGTIYSIGPPDGTA